MTTLPTTISTNVALNSNETADVKLLTVFSDQARRMMVTRTFTHGASSVQYNSKYIGYSDCNVCNGIGTPTILSMKSEKGVVTYPSQCTACEERFTSLPARKRAEKYRIMALDRYTNVRARFMTNVPKRTKKGVTLFKLPLNEREVLWVQLNTACLRMIKKVILRYVKLHPDLTEADYHKALWQTEKTFGNGIENSIQRAIAQQRRALSILVDGVNVQKFTMSNMNTSFTSTYNRPSLPLSKITQASNYARKHLTKHKRIGAGTHALHGMELKNFMQEMMNTQWFVPQNCTKEDILVASVLHDLRKVGVSKETLKKEFGETVANIVDAMAIEHVAKDSTIDNVIIALDAAKLGDDILVLLLVERLLNLLDAVDIQKDNIGIRWATESIAFVETLKGSVKPRKHKILIDGLMSAIYNSAISRINALKIGVYAYK